MAGRRRGPHKSGVFIIFFFFLKDTLLFLGGPLKPILGVSKDTEDTEDTLGLPIRGYTYFIFFYF